MMLALSLWRPWPWAFFHCGKNVENRTWRLPRWAIGKPIAMHATKSFDEEAFARMRAGELGEAAEACPLIFDHPQGVVGVFTFPGPSPTLAECKVPPPPWAFGPYVWPVVDVVELPEPIPCRGRQKLWELPRDVERAVREQLGLEAP